MDAMASSDAVPHVPSTSVRFTVPADLASLVDEWANGHHLSRDEGLEVLLRGRLAGEASSATDLWAAYQRGEVQSAADIEAALTRAEVGDAVMGIRLGARRPVTDTTPFRRDHMGADLDDVPADVWPAVRGLWRIHPRWRYVVAFRLGRPLALYRVVGWEQEAKSGRRWAIGGQIVQNGRRVDADTGEDQAEASPVDLAIVDAVMARPLAMTAGAANPLVLLNNR